jgi:integrase/recombinase XerC
VNVTRGPRRGGSRPPAIIPPAFSSEAPEILAGERTLRAYVPIFLGWFGSAADRSPLTIASYATGLTMFLTFCDAHGMTLPRHVTPIAVEAFLGTMRQQGRKASTVNQRRYALVSFFDFLQRRQAVANNPPRLAIRMRESRPLPDYIAPGNQRPLLEALMDDRSPRGLRNLAVVGTFLLCGLRAAELAGLHLSALDYPNTLKVIQGKGRKDRFCVVIPWLREVLNQYLELSRPALLKGRPDPGHVFLSRRGRPFSQRTLWFLISRLLSPIVGKHVHPHMLRHSFASRVMAGGGNVVWLQKGMGHSRLDTTAIYTHLPDDLFVRQFTTWLSGEALTEPDPIATLPPLEGMAKSLEPDLPPPPDAPVPDLALPDPDDVPEAPRYSHPFADPARRAALRAKRHTWKKERN